MSARYPQGRGGAARPTAPHGGAQRRSRRRRSNGGRSAHRIRRPAAPHPLQPRWERPPAALLRPPRPRLTPEHLAELPDATTARRRYAALRARARAQCHAQLTPPAHTAAGCAVDRPQGRAERASHPGNAGGCARVSARYPQGRGGAARPTAPHGGAQRRSRRRRSNGGRSAHRIRRPAAPHPLQPRWERPPAALLRPPRPRLTPEHLAELPDATTARRRYAALRARARAQCHAQLTPPAHTAAGCALDRPQGRMRVRCKVVK